MLAGSSSHAHVDCRDGEFCVATVLRYARPELVSELLAPASQSFANFEDLRVLANAARVHDLAPA